jgi:hypothetical protein
VYIGGFFLLPWLWFVNWLYYREAVKLPATADGMKSGAPLQ